MTIVPADDQDLGVPPAIAGLRLDGRAVVMIDAEENERLCRTTGVDPDPLGEAHPSYYYVVTQVGMGLSVAQLCEACDFDVRNGPMMATSAVRFHERLMTETPYRVRGQVLALVRKRSRSLGLMDLLDYKLDLHGMDDALILEVRNTWVLPRGPVK